MAGVNCDSSATLKELRQIERNADKQIKQIMRSTKTQSAKWVAAGVSQEYAITRAHFKETGKRRVYGNLQHLEIKYSGSRLDISDFKLKPMFPPETRQPYTLKGKVKKGGSLKTISKVGTPTREQWRNIGRNRGKRGTKNSTGSPIMLMRMPNQRNYHPFQRKSQNRTDLYWRKSIAPPQMVTEGENGPMRATVEKEVYAGINKLMDKKAASLLK